MSDMREDINKRRKQRSKAAFLRRLKIGLVVFFVLALIVGVVLSLTVLFPVKTVSAAGSKIYSSKQIINLSGISSEDNFFMLSEKEVTDSIRKNLPYIDTVEIERKLPDTINIKVTDAKEYACYNYKGAYFVVSESGFVMNRYSEVPAGVFEIVCKEKEIECDIGSQIVYKNPTAKTRIDEMTELLKKEKIEINRIDVSNPISLSVKVCNRFEVLFGTSADLDKKIAHLGSMIKNIDAEKTGKINLSMWTSDKTQGSFVEGAIE